MSNLFDKLRNFEQRALSAEFHLRLAGREITLKVELVYFALACLFMVRPYYVQISALNYVWAAVTMVFAALTTVQVLISKKLLRASLLLYAFCLLYVVSTALYETLARRYFSEAHNRLGDSCWESESKRNGCLRAEMLQSIMLRSADNVSFG